jgi:hypothetical protein
LIDGLGTAWCFLDIQLALRDVTLDRYLPYHGRRVGGRGGGQ